VAVGSDPCAILAATTVLDAMIGSGAVIKCLNDITIGRKRPARADVSVTKKSGEPRSACMSKGAEIPDNQGEA
jgi:hypothetical protein